MTETIDHIVLPDQSTVEIRDHERGKPYGIATLDENEQLQQMFSGYAVEYPSPDEHYNLLEYLLHYIVSYTPGA